MKIFCIGRNYAEHAKELGNEQPSEPVIFLKPETALLRPTDSFFMPNFSSEIHHEIEVVLRVGRNGKSINRKFAQNYIDAVSVGIDFTARDIQNHLKSKGLPWEISKAFDGSACVGKWIEIENFDKFPIQHFELMNNGLSVQKGNIEDMIFGFGELIEHISKYFTIKKGDLIYTGTPKGVSKISTGDVLTGFANNQKMFELKIV